ncbi:MAG: hypothetical protein GY804_08720 [Alphaproteobacteria bacterium]|nr:hypothetical protein [Alphaproteobacteria bacterium]
MDEILNWFIVNRSFFIIPLSGAAQYCISKPKLYKWGFVVGLLGQPFWFIIATRNIKQDWGMFILMCWVTICHIIGIYHQFIEPHINKGEFKMDWLTVICPVASMKRQGCKFSHRLVALIGMFIPIIMTINGYFSQTFTPKYVTMIIMSWIIPVLYAYCRCKIITNKKEQLRSSMRQGCDVTAGYAQQKGRHIQTDNGLDDDDELFEDDDAEDDDVIEHTTYPRGLTPTVQPWDDAVEQRDPVIPSQDDMNHSTSFKSDVESPPINNSPPEPSSYGGDDNDE